MDAHELEQRLSRIATQWTMVFRAHQAPPDDAGAARRRLMERYSGAAYRYLLGAVRDADVAADLCQDFAVRFLRGDFHRAAKERGRFRDYLKTALIHLVTDYHRARQAWPQGLPDDPAAPPRASSAQEDASFLQNWRDELLERTWQALAAEQPTYHAVLKLRIAEPELPSSAMAERLTRELGKPMTAANVRKALQRAHDRFADLLLEEIACSLDTHETEALRAELTELDLLKYCAHALERRGVAE
jgi:RNA polymerase sigma-70 factor (ECF subfamily)